MKNIFTDMIADELDVNDSVALRVHNHIDKFYQLDWSEADEKLIRKTAQLAFEDLNEVVPQNIF
jgi:hypothetical protein